MTTQQPSIAAIDAWAQPGSAQLVNRPEFASLWRATGVVDEAMVAIVQAGAMLEKFGGDSLDETHRNFEAYIGTLRPRGRAMTKRRDK